MKLFFVIFRKRIYFMLHAGDIKVYAFMTAIFI